MTADIMEDLSQNVLVPRILLIILILLIVLIVSALISWNIKWVIEQSINVLKKIKRKR